ncbi:uncharacterized protein SETTUDRAFT_24912 [Exserohilum turcica Et28A]|uniref:Uncharacterized protein n=1 Tax=Exserohilum turcicum (strain 28A) TaxID=671987 RepID=R0KSL1_EXST2|nr:uncharacterized protein SETTUDRAFT_24912 [Exserohilum turcica Et28A]EOA90782.1 hypothetical protein SETTUDRAFT_24912 [Exserohilum turcica Et28A]
MRREIRVRDAKKNVTQGTSQNLHRTPIKHTSSPPAVVASTRPANMLRILNRILGRQQNTLPPFDFARNKYRVKKKWPPNLRALTEKQQFRFERKFKRRIKLKSIRPEWNKWTKIVQWSLISFIVVYGVLFHDFRKDPMNPRPGEQPFEGLRQRMWRLFGGFYTQTENVMKGEGGVRGARRLERTEEEEEKVHGAAPLSSSSSSSPA